MACKRPTEIKVGLYEGKERERRGEREHGWYLAFSAEGCSLESCPARGECLARYLS